MRLCTGELNWFWPLYEVDLDALPAAFELHIELN